MVPQGSSPRRIAALLGVSPSGYYAWRARGPSPHALRRAWLTRLIRDIHQASNSTYGYRRVRQELFDHYGLKVGHTTVEHLMKEAGLRGQAGRRHAPGMREGARTPGSRWIVDVLAFTTPEGALHAAVVLDAASGRLIGYSTATTAHRALVHHALAAALARAARTRPAAAHGAHEALPACSFTERAGSLSCGPVRKGAGDRYDHAVADAFGHTLRRALGACCRPGPHVLEDRLRTLLDNFTRQT
ncbi:IS3 family transposase [Streptomyces sp. AF1A]|jgi:putative transposase|uniref:IS3 family transposase n=1 Tax=Streptomyces sp. AF1A TaxID=3394350 RepID=UPI0039BC8BFF